MSRKQAIRAVTFDVGNTLIEPRVSVGQVYAEVAAAHGFRGLSPEKLNHRFHAAFRAHGGAVNTQEDWARIVDQTFAGLITQPPSKTFFPELFEHFGQPDAWRIFDDVRPALEALSRHGFRFGVISNWDERLRPLFDALQLAEHFEVLVISCEAGVAKPAREIFELAAKRLSLSPSEIFHVGDSLETDVLGARAAGFCAAQIARGQPAGPDRLASLRNLLSRLGPGGK